MPPQPWGGVRASFDVDCCRGCILWRPLPTCLLASSKGSSTATALPKAHKWTTQIEDLRGSSISAQKSLNIIVQRLTVSKSLWNHWNAPIRWCHGGHPAANQGNLQPGSLCFGFRCSGGKGLRSNMGREGRPLEIYHDSEE